MIDTCEIEVQGCRPQQAAWLRAALGHRGKAPSGWSARRDSLILTFAGKGSAYQVCRVVERVWEAAHPNLPVRILRRHG